MAAKKVAIIVMVEKGSLDPSVWGLAALAEKVTDKDTADVRWLALGRQTAEAAAVLAERSGYPATALETAPAAPTGDMWLAILRPILEDLRPELILMLHSAHAQDFAAALAIALDTACIPAVQGIATKGPGLRFERAILGGRLTAEIQTDGRPAIVTVLPGYFRPRESNPTSARIETRRPPLPKTRVRIVEIRKENTDTGLSQADTIIAAGRGIGSRENLALIRKLASCFPRSAIAGSRIVCDAGWLAYGCQVGVTGAAVTPKLYVACGISGAPQHVAGMQGAELIVAINKDPHAAIYNWADVGVVEDLEVFLPLLIEAIEEID